MVKYKGFLPVQLVDQLVKGVQLAAVDLVHLAVIIVQAAIAQLQQLVGQGRRLLGSNGFAVHLQQAFLLHGFISRSGLCVQHNRHVLHDLFRQLQQIGCFETQHQIRDLAPDRIARPVLGFPAVFCGPEIGLPVVRDILAQPLPLIQQIDLRPEVQQVVGRRGAGQLHHLGDLRAHSLQRLKPLGGMVLETGCFVQHHHVKGPVSAVVPHQPVAVFAVDDIHICRGVQGCNALRLGAQHSGDPQVLEVIPLLYLILPCSFCHLLRCHNQHAPDFGSIIDQGVNGGQGNYGFTQTHLHPQRNTGLVKDRVNSRLLIRVRREMLHKV